MYMENNKNQNKAVVQRQGSKQPLKPKEEEEEEEVLSTSHL